MKWLRWLTWTCDASFGVLAVIAIDHFQKKKMKKGQDEIAKKHRCNQVWRKDPKDDKETMWKEDMLKHVRENVFCMEIADPPALDFTTQTLENLLMMKWCLLTMKWDQKMKTSQHLQTSLKQSIQLTAQCKLMLLLLATTDDEVDKGDNNNSDNSIVMNAMKEPGNGINVDALSFKFKGKLFQATLPAYHTIIRKNCLSFLEKGSDVTSELQKRMSGERFV